MTTQTISTMVGDIVVGETNWGNEEEQQQKVFSDNIDESTNIRVALRCRPPNKRELAGDGGEVIVKIPGPNASAGIVTVGEGKKMKPFSFDLAFPMDSTQLQVFEAIGVDIVQAAFHGYNASLFAYGQTSSGKSFSMMGVPDSDLIGLIPRISRLLFGAAKNSEKTFEIDASYLEIYNEKLSDLLVNGKTKGKATTELKIRENKQSGVHVAGLIKEPIKSSEETLAIIERGFKERTTAATLYNAESSRSHAIFEINMKAKFKDNGTGEDMISSSRIALIDLAGSERSSKVGTKGTALKEGNNINKSLTVLGRCIRSLVEISKGKKVSVPFRESVLTWYLRDSLAGNAKTTMLAACSPVDSNMEETLSTLRYADSAKNIKTAAKKNEDPAQARIRELTSELELIKQRLAEMEKLENGQGGGGGVDLSHMTEEEKTKLLATLRDQMGIIQDNERFVRGDSKKDDDTNKDKIEDETKDKKKDDDIVAPTLYPMLSCLNKDNLLSHAMTIPLSFNNQKDQNNDKDEKKTSFTVGRTLDVSTDEMDNDFELNGMGIKSHHCQFNLSSKNDSENDSENKDKSVVVIPLTRGASVYVNGTPLLEIADSGKFEVSKPLQHLDRIIFGPGRLISLYLTKPLTREEKDLWDYEKSFQEMISVGSPDIGELVSESRRNVLNLLNTVNMDQITQGNMMASEMGVPIRFEVDMVVRGQKGVLEPNLAFDTFLDLNDLSIFVKCHTNINSKIITAQDLVNASFTFYHEQKEANSKSSTKKLDQMTSLTDENPILINSSSYSTMTDLLFEISLNEFEDVLFMLKEAYTSISTLTGGLMASRSDTNDISSSNHHHGNGGGGEMGGNTEGSRMVRKVFEVLDDDKSGNIEGEELKKGLIIFNPNHDESLINEIWKEEKFTSTEDISMNLNEFEEFLIRFMQRQFYKCIEPYVTNRRAFSIIGGRDMYKLVKDSIMKIDEYEMKLQNALAEVLALQNEKEMILKQSQESSAKVQFMLSEANKMKEKQLQDHQDHKNVTDEIIPKKKKHIGETNMLAIGLVRAKNLIAADVNLLNFGASTSDPFVKFRFVTEKHVEKHKKLNKVQRLSTHVKSLFSSEKKWLAQSSVKKQTLNPVWNELYYFPTNIHAEDKILEIKIDDWDFAKCDFLGKAYINLSDIPHDGNLIKLELPLHDYYGHEDIIRGTVELNLSWVHDDFKATLEGKVAPPTPPSSLALSAVSSLSKVNEEKSTPTETRKQNEFPSTLSPSKSAEEATVAAAAAAVKQNEY